MPWPTLKKKKNFWLQTKRFLMKLLNYTKKPKLKLKQTGQRLRDSLRSQLLRKMKLRL